MVEVLAKDIYLHFLFIYSFTYLFIFAAMQNVTLGVFCMIKIKTIDKDRFDIRIYLHKKKMQHLRLCNK